MLNVEDSHPLRRLFAGLVEHAFCSEIGICDPELTEYVAELLTGFTHIDRFNTLRNAEGKRLEQMAAMLAAEQLAETDEPLTQAERDRTVYRHIGDFSLFWAGG